jgi:hypothetical protein
MDTNTEPEKPGRRRKSRPIGLMFLAPGDALFAGIFPLIGVFLIYNSDQGAMPLGQFVFHIAVAVFLIAAAGGAFYGDEFCRKALLALITIHYSSTILINILATSDDGVRGSDQIRAINFVTRALFWLGVNWWYLNKKSTLDYFV